MTILDEYPFALCLTHDVDRIRKTYQAVYNAIIDRQPSELLDLLPWRDPYWQFQKIMDLEEALGVRSAFYFLNEQRLFRDKPVRAWFRPEAWKLYMGRYALDETKVERVIQELDRRGWEIGLHGSYDSYQDKARLADEKTDLEGVLGHSVIGCRQHYLNLDQPRTWRYQTEVGLRYDTSLGSADDYGFHGRHEPIRPFGDAFVVFPLTLMEISLPGIDTNPEGAWSKCENLLFEADANSAVMTVLWHPRYFYEGDYPNYGPLYRRLIQRALDLGAWVGPPGDFYRSMDHPDGEPPISEGHDHCHRIRGRTGWPNTETISE